MTYMLYSRISNQGGSLSSLHCELLSPTCYCCISMPASARTNLSYSQREVLFGTQLYKPMAFFHLFLFPEKGGRGLVKTIFILTTQVLVHLQLQVRGGVSLGQYYSTVRAIHSPRAYIRIIISLWMQSP